MQDDMNSIDGRLSTIAVSAAKKAADYLLQEQSSVYITRRNSRTDAQYNIDRQANHIIVQQLREMTPSFGLLSEESRFIEGSDPYTWIIDPLDGSANYFRGSPLFGIAIGLRVQEKLALGVIHLPVAQETFVALSGQGAYRNGKRIQVSAVGDLSRAFIHFGVFSSDARSVSKRTLFIEGIESTVQRIRILGSSAVDFAYVSCGRADGLLMQPLHPWDEDVGRLMLAEAGGQATHIPSAAQPILVVSNAAVHLPLVHITRRIIDRHS